MSNVFKYTKQLEEAGFSRQQAEIQLQVITEMVEGDLATKQDFENFRQSTKQDLESLRQSTKQDLENFKQSTKQDFENLKQSTKQDLVLLETNFDSKIHQLEYRIVVKLGTIVVTTTSLAVALTSWLMKIH